MSFFFWTGLTRIVRYMRKGFQVGGLHCPICGEDSLPASSHTESVFPTRRHCAPCGIRFNVSLTSLVLQPFLRFIGVAAPLSEMPPLPKSPPQRGKDPTLPHYLPQHASRNVPPPSTPQKRVEVELRVGSVVLQFTCTRTAGVTENPSPGSAPMRKPLALKKPSNSSHLESIALD